MNTNRITLLLSITILGSAMFVGNIFAEERSNIADLKYPILELNNCTSETDCRAYCDLPASMEACVNFGEKNNLLSKEELRTAKKFIAAGARGPGDCKGKDACEAYCNDIAHIDACLAFAEHNDLLPQKELEEARKVQAALKRGVKAPSCGNKKACDVYCEDPNHMEECIAFGMEAGFIEGKELEDAQKMLVALKKGVRPLPCRGKEACELYCSNPNNMEMCMNFAIEAGFMNEQEQAESQKVLAAIKKGVKPPACTNKEACDAYCASDEHFEECANFAEAAGFMSSEEAAMTRKTKGKGPGDCKGKEACEAFCNNPDNQEICFEFAKENGMLPEGELQKMEEGKAQFQKSIQELPSEVSSCLESLLGADVVKKIKNGELMPSQKIGDMMSTCVTQMSPPSDFADQKNPSMDGQKTDEIMPPPLGQQYQSGPGGCTNPDECRIYCELNPQECQKNEPPPQPQMGNAPFEPPPQFGPLPLPDKNQDAWNNMQTPQNLNCKTPEECQQILLQDTQKPIGTEILPIEQYHGTKPFNTLGDELPQMPLTYPSDKPGIAPQPVPAPMPPAESYPMQGSEAPPIEPPHIEQNTYPSYPTDQPVEQQSPPEQYQTQTPEPNQSET